MQICDMKTGNGIIIRFSSSSSKWVEQIDNSESKHEQMKYMLNAYRVLLTRARAGMVICVPEGNEHKTLSGFWEG